MIKEEVIKDSTERQDYVDSLNSFISVQKEKGKKERRDFITPKKLKKHYKYYYNKYVEMLGFPLTEKPVSPTLLSKTLVGSDKDYSVYRMQFEIKGIKFYGIYFEHDDSTDKTPFSICLHGGDGSPEIVSGIYFDSANYNHIAERVLEKGVNVFCPQLLLWNRDTYGNKDYDRGLLDLKLKQLGGSISALEVFLMSSSITYFIENEKIDKSRVGALGMSYGGMYTILLTAFDKRIKCAYSSSYFNEHFDNAWSDWTYKNSYLTFTDPEICTLIAPRALELSIGDHDPLFNAESFNKETAILKEYYDYLGASDKLDFYLYNGDHEVDKTGDRSIEFFLKNL